MRDATFPRIVGEADFGEFTTGQILDVLTAVTVILALPRSAAEHVDAIAVATGQGEEWRLTQGIRAWEVNPGLRHLLVANGNPTEETYNEITLGYLRGLGLRRIDGVVLQTAPAPNTGLQAAWIAQQVRALGIASIALTVSSYHLPRAYLTVLKAASTLEVRLPIIPVPVAVSPDTPVPETGATAYDLVGGEVRRILAYRSRGWVASDEELRQYLGWLWSRHGALLASPSSLPSTSEEPTSARQPGNERR
ncbi:YdcF family protein [Micromonospora sp. GCM10011542]|uniref:YdcF family protein n=1 Tax=Micromonospora sp. GCM10011542 TaxID=3317337 RepID=UPI00360E1E36